MLVEFVDDTLTNYLSEQQKVLKKWRLKFIMHIWEFQSKMGKYIRGLVKSYVLQKHYDTGTMHKRVDFKVLNWNRIVFGIFEPSSEYYDPAQHYPTAEFMWRYRNWKPNPTKKEYAGYVHSKDPFYDRILDEVQWKVLSREVHDFMQDNPVV